MMQTPALREFYFIEHKNKNRLSAVSLLVLHKDSNIILNGDHGRKKTKTAFRRFAGAPTGIRTPVVALKGLRPSPLDDGGIS